MGDGSHQPAVLDNGRSAHALHDATCFSDELRIRDFQHHFLVFMIGILIHFPNLDVIVRGLAAYGAEYLGIPCLHLLPQSYFHGLRGYFFQHFFIADTVNALIGIFGNFSQNVALRIFYHARHFPGISLFSFADGYNPGFIKGSAFYLHGDAGIHIADAVPQCAEISFAVYKGHGADTLGIVPDPDTDFIFTRRIFFRDDRNIHGFVLPPYGKRHLISAGIFHHGNKLLFVRDLLPVHGYDIVPCF